MKCLYKRACNERRRVLSTAVMSNVLSAVVSTVLQFTTVVGDDDDGARPGSLALAMAGRPRR